MDQRSWEAAVRSSWDIRESQAAKKLLGGKTDTGGRGAVTGGAHLDALTTLLAQVFLDAGFPPDSVRSKSKVELPGYFRPTKKWDLVVLHEGELVAAIELKSHVGPSFGNNFNNRNEEAIGSAVDLRRAYDHGLLGRLRPWLGYVLLVEEAPASLRPGVPRSGTFPIDPAFTKTSYVDRYVILCKRLRSAGLYDATCLVTSSREADAPVRQPDLEVGFPAFVGAIMDRTEEFGVVQPKRN
ncbi:PaeR7I family type II restriction endonuclease [Micromonospora sp. AKA38]|uniref:PaeR7I family type II restriction endonuclease n=1 Tax=Micromonospora sp. AKA38 TaxID=2733861 RepID=UPI0022C669B9|nr:PaeR7I family type II restriction endonuclease [Micromonospora sp. AKA38]GHJ17910.1 type-2 restriction enzyme [Micromonospora sp. AKA38]